MPREVLGERAYCHCGTSLYSVSTSESKRGSQDERLEEDFESDDQDDDEDLDQEDDSLDEYVPENTRSYRRRAERQTFLIVALLFALSSIVRLLLLGAVLFPNLNPDILAWLPMECKLSTFGAFACLAFAVYNIATLTGWLLEDRWGWWMAIIGLPWGACQWIASGFVTSLTAEPAWKGYLVMGIGLLLLPALSFLLWLMLGRKMQNRYGVLSGQTAPLVLGNFIGALLAGGFAAILLQQLR
jgi:hypothetical protein